MFKYALQFCTAAVACIFAGSAVIFFAWVLGWEEIYKSNPLIFSMRPDAAAGFFLLSALLLNLRFKKTPQWVSDAIGTFCILLGLMILLNPHLPGKSRISFFFLSVRLYENLHPDYYKISGMIGVFLVFAAFQLLTASRASTMVIRLLAMLEFIMFSLAISITVFYLLDRAEFADFPLISLPVSVFGMIFSISMIILLPPDDTLLPLESERFFFRLVAPIVLMSLFYFLLLGGEYLKLYGNATTSLVIVASIGVLLMYIILFYADVLRCARQRVSSLDSDLLWQNTSLSSLGEISSEFLYIVEWNQGRVFPLWVSGSSVAVTGYSSDEIKDMGNLAKIVHPDDLSNVLENQHRVFAGGSNVSEYRIINKNGQIRWVENRTKSIRLDENVVRVLGSSRDISEQKSFTAEIEKSREQLRQLNSRLANVREQERKLISREIHDNLGQSLTALKFQTDALRTGAADSASDLCGKIDQITAGIDAMMELVRDLSARLRPGILDDFGLSAAIEWELKRFEKTTGISCVFSNETGDSSFPEGLSAAIYRICQEIMTNIARHARATRADIQLQNGGNSIILTVQDNGQGMPMEKITAMESLGILGMKERAAEFGGSLCIDSGSHGTCVTLKIPLNKNQKAERK